MDSRKFGQESPGQVVRLSGPEPDWAFVPAPLPPHRCFPERLWPALVKARSSLSKLDGIGRTLPNPQLLLRPLQQREAIRSSSLEGTYASPEELLLFELHPRRPTSERDRANDWLEVANYGRALREGLSLLEKQPFSLRLIRNLHSYLLEGVRGRDKLRGEFRRYQVHIGSDRRYIPPPVPEMHACLDAFEKHMNATESDYDPLVRCYLIHYQFEAIHPFVDGNGRVGRVLLSLMINAWCDLHMPWLYMSAFFDRYRDEYITKLFRISTDAAWEDWIEFCLRGTVEQAEDSIRRCDGLGIVKSDFHLRANGLSTRMHSIIDGLFTASIITIPELARRFSVTYDTAKTDIDQLVKAEILTQVPNLKPKTFVAPAIYQLAYKDNLEE